MKNKIFILIAIVSSLFLIDNVRAETTEPVSSKYFDIYSSEILNRIETDYFNTALTDFDTKFNEVYSEYKNDYPYYLTMAYCNYSNSCGFQTYIFDIIPKFKWKIYYGNSNLYQLLWNDETGIGNFNYLKAKTKLININQATVINNFEFETTVYNQSNLSWDSLVYGYGFDKDGSRFYKSYGYFIYDSNFDILKEDDHALKSSRENVDIKINDTYYQADDIIPSYKEFKNPKPKTPKININIEDYEYNEKNEVISKKIFVDFGIYDFEKYIYEYTSSNNYLDDKNEFYWLSYVDNYKPLEITVNANNTYIFRVIDKTTNEIIDSSTVNINNIVGNLPFIVLRKNNYTCNIDYKNQIYHVCESFWLFAKKIDYSKYSLQYSFDLENWTDHNNNYNNEITMYENGTLFVRIIDLITNDVVDSLTYTVTTINMPKDNIPFVEFNYSCDPDTMYVIDLKLYNFDSDKYNIFYRKGNDDDFELIEISNTIYNNFYYYKIYSVIPPTTIVVKIEDKEGNYVYGTSFTYTYSYCDSIDDEIEKKYNFDDVFNDIDSDFEFFESNNSFFAKLLRIIFDTCPDNVMNFFIKFLMLSIVGIFIYVLGWK